ncbi:MAG TPA: hypothetical protein VL947_03635 [Cytophagales bacterium]|nr:hypothetical protein [Cytophagales bacterium]
MSNQDHIEQLIESYTKGTLKGDALVAFENMLSNDDTLKRKVDLYKTSNNLVVLHRLKEVNAVLKAKTAEVKKRDSGLDTMSKAMIGLTGIALLGALLYYTIGDQNGTPTVKQDDIHTAAATKQEPSSKGSEVVRSQEKVLDFKKNIVKPIINTREQSSTGSQVDHTPILGSVSKEDIHVSEKAESTPKEVGVAVRDQDTSKTHRTIQPCEGLVIKMEVKSEAACRGEADGEIHINHIKGGTLPYSFILNESIKNNSGRFTHLHEGHYTIRAIDKNNCQSDLVHLDLPEKICRLDLHFSPFKGEEIVFPTYEKSGNLSIFDKMGGMYYQKQLLADEKFAWTGQSSSGELAAGYYVFVIQYADGAVQKGSITIAP